MRRNKFHFGRQTDLRADHPAHVRNVAIFFGLMAGAFLLYWLIGLSGRATYLGATRMGDDMALHTVPSNHYIMARGPAFARLKPGCRYDFNYAPAFPSKSSASRNKWRPVRSATLVDCPNLK